MENRIDQIFKSKLENFERNPPIGLLEQINEQIAYRTRVRRINQIKTAVSIAASLILVLLAGWYTIDENRLADNTIPVQVQENPVVKPEIAKENLASLSTPAVKTPEVTTVIRQRQASHKVGSVAKSAANSISTSNKEVSTEANRVSQSKATEHPVAANNDQSKGPTKEQAPEKQAVQRQKNAEPLYFVDSYQPKQRAKSEKGSWEIKAELSPMFASSGSVGNASSKSMSTLSGGMLASYRLNKKVSISSGVRFAQMKQGTHTDYFLNAKSGITYLEPVEKSANIARDVSLYLPSTSSIVYANGMQAAASNVFKSDISQDFKYLEIPVQATYKLIDNTLSLGITGGISTNILIGNVASITENGIKLSQGSTDNMRDVIYSGSAGLELGYGLGKNLVLTVEPRIKQYMHSVSSNDLINFKPLQMGIFTGITYTFD